MVGPFASAAICVCGMVIALVGCGSANAPSSARPPITKTEAIAFARMVNLRASDLPEGKAVPRKVHSNAPSHEEGFRCGRVGNLIARPVGTEVSFLTDRYGFVGSTVLVKPTETLAEAELAAVGSSKGRICLVHTLGAVEGVQSEKTTVTSFAVKVTFVPVANMLGSGAIGLRVVAKLPPVGFNNPTPSPNTPKTQNSKPRPTFIYVDAFFFRVGPAEISLITYGEHQPPAGTEAKLLSLLHSRAELHKLRAT